MTRALGMETGNPIMTFEQRSSFLLSSVVWMVESVVERFLIPVDAAIFGHSLGPGEVRGVVCVCVFITGEGESVVLTFCINSTRA